MKKLLMAANVFLFLVASSMLMSSKGCNEPDPVPDVKECDHCKDFSKDRFEGIPAGLAFTMISKYKANHWNNYRVAGNTLPTDARSVWFSLEEMKRFIWTLEQQVCNKQCKDTQTLGLRFYYAEYPKANVWNNLETLDNDDAVRTKQEAHRAEYQGLHTVVITPTYWSKGSGMNVDFDPRYYDEKCTPKNMQSVFKELEVQFDTVENKLVSTNAGRAAFILSPDEKTSIKNRGSLIPPPPPSGSSSSGELNGAVIFDIMENTFRTY